MPKKRDTTYNVILYLIYVLIMCFIISHKANLNIDELANFTLSNAYHWFSPEDGVSYTPAEQPFIESMASNGHIDFRHVWQLQVQDGNHPPLYYALNHIFCTLLAPGKISMWPSGILNIIFQLLSLFFVRKILDVFEVDETAKTIMSLGYMLCGGILSLVAFYRMYTMLMFLVIVFNYLLIRNISGFSFRTFIWLFLVTVIGALTQYYFLFCAFFSSLVFGVILLAEKRYKEAVEYIVTMGLAGMVALFIFPEIRWQLSPGGEGGNALNNLVELDTLSQIREFWKILNQQLFGKMFIILLLSLFVSAIVCFYRKRAVVISKRDLQRYAILLISSVGVFGIVAKSAFVNSDRYVSPIYALVFVLVYTIIYRFINTAVENKIGNILFAACVLVVVVGSMLNTNWGYALPVNEGADYASDNLTVTPALCVWGDPAMANTCMQEIQYCSEAVYYKAKDYTEFRTYELDEGLLEDDLVLFVAMNDQEGFKDEFIRQYPQYHVIKAYSHGYSSMYHLAMN